MALSGRSQCPTPFYYNPDFSHSFQVQVCWASVPQPEKVLESLPSLEKSQTIPLWLGSCSGPLSTILLCL